MGLDSGNEALPVKEIRINPEVLESLKGTFSEKMELTVRDGGGKDDGRLILSGMGWFGHPDIEERRRFAGYIDHVCKVMRLVEYLANELRRGGVEIDTERVVNFVLCWKLARQVYRQAAKYQEAHDRWEGDFPESEIHAAAEILEKIGMSEEMVVMVRHLPGHQEIKGRGDSIQLNHEMRLAAFADVNTVPVVAKIAQQFVQYAVLDGWKESVQSSPDLLDKLGGILGECVDRFGEIEGDVEERLDVVNEMAMGSFEQEFGDVFEVDGGGQYSWRHIFVGFLRSELVIRQEVLGDYGVEVPVVDDVPVAEWEQKFRDLYEGSGELAF